MNSRNLYHAEVTGFSVDVEKNSDLVNLSNVIDSDGDLVANEMDLVHGSWSSNLESGLNISFTAKLNSRVQRQFIDDRWYNVRQCFLCKPKIKT